MRYLLNTPKLIGAYYLFSVFFWLSGGATGYGQSTPVFTEFPLPNDGLVLDGITPGNDGNVWFSMKGVGTIGKITPSGLITELQLQTADPSGVAPQGIVFGPDGNVWFADSMGDHVGKMTTSGVTTLYPMPKFAIPNYIVAGADGNLWVTGSSPNIYRVTTNGAVTVFPLPSQNQGAQGIVAGPDGNLWFTEGPKIGKITPAGVITEFPLPNSHSALYIAVGPDGNLWFTEGESLNFGRITLSGVITEFPTPNYETEIVGRADGLWFVDSSDSIGLLTTSGTISTFHVPTQGNAINSITVGPDGNIWFTEFAARKIGKLSFSGTAAPLSINCNNPFSNSAPFVGGTFSYSCSAAGGVPPYQWKTTGSLPAGISFGGTGQTVTATGTITSPGQYSFSFVVTDSSSVPATAQFQVSGVVSPGKLTISCGSPPLPTTVGVTYSNSCTASGGTPPYNWSANQDRFPVISHSYTGPTFTFSGSAQTTPDHTAYSFSIQARDQSVPSPQTATQSFSGVATMPLVINCDIATFAYTNYAYNELCEASGGTTPYSWTVSSGVLPGQSAIAGPTNTPQLAVRVFSATTGGYSFAFKVTDSTSPVPMVTTKTFSGTFLPGLSISCTQPNPPFFLGVSYKVNCQAAGGMPPYTWSLGSTPPAGVTLIPSGSTATLTGIPDTTGPFGYTFYVSDNTYYLTAATTISGFVTVPLSLSCASGFGPAAQGKAYSDSCIASGGTPPYRWSISPGSLPGGLSLSANATQATVIGTPGSPGAFDYTLLLADSTSPQSLTQMQRFQGTISPATSSLPALPHFAAQNSWTTGIFVVNTGAQSANFSVSFRDDLGNAIALPFGGGATSDLTGSLPAYGSAYYEASDPIAALISGWGQLTADPSIEIQALFRDDSSGTFYEAAVPSVLGSNEFEIPFDATIFAATGQQFFTGFAIANLDPLNRATVTCTARDGSGAAIPNAFTASTGPPQINAQGHWSGYLFPALTGTRGTIDCVSNTAIAATALRFIGGNAFSSLPVVEKPIVTLAATSALPHFAEGDIWTTGIFVMNTAATPANFAIGFRDDNGKSIALPFGGGTISNLAGTLPAFGSAYYEAGDPAAALVSGWGQITADPSIVVQALFRENANGTYYEASVPSNPGAKEFEIPFDDTLFASTGEQFFTGFAIANLDPLIQATITCTARDSSGAVIPNVFIGATGPPALPPLGHWAGYLFSALTGRRGTIDCASNTVVAAMALRFIGANAFSSLPVINK